MASIPIRRRRARRARTSTPSVLADLPTPHQLEIARRCRTALKTIFLSRPGGRADEAALDEIKELCLGALRAIDDPVCGGRLLTIHCCAAALYSESAHRHWNTESTSGIDRLRQRIFRALVSYQRRLYQLEALQPDLSCPSAGEQRKLLAQAGDPLRL